MKYDLLIPAAPKDYSKVPFVVESARQHLNPQPENIFVVSPTPLEIAGVTWKDEQEVMPLDPLAATMVPRPRWIYQQFIKLFLDVTPNDKYLIVDSDLIFNKDIELFTEDGKTKFFLGKDQNYLQYFFFMELVLSFGREYDHSFISELMMFDKKICNHLLEELGMDVEGFYKCCCNKVDGSRYLIADYEIYGQFAWKYHQDEHKLVRFKTHLEGGYSSYTAEKIQSTIDSMKNSDYDVFTIHTWVKKEER